MEKEKQEVKLPKPILIEDLGYLYPKEDSKKKRRYGIYKCGFCGKEFRTQISGVKNGNTKSCGCYQKRRMSETHKTHRLKSTRLYTIWRDIKSRTLNPKCKKYVDYGGRGITVCEEWKNDFMSFYNWAMSNGYIDELSIDRIDNDGNYEPSNCRWVSSNIQNRNKRISKSNTSGYKGVCFIEDRNNFRVSLSVNKKKNISRVL